MMIENTGNITSGLYANTSMSPQNILEYVPQHFQDACNNFHTDIIQTMSNTYKEYLIILVVMLTIRILVNELSFLYENTKIYAFYMKHIIGKIDLFMIIIAWIVLLMAIAY